ncbi:hypothetical protein ACFE04_000351 [Oxalis oulophora]
MDEFDKYRSEEEELLLLGEDVTSQLTQLKKPKPPPPLLTESQLASSPCCSCASADADQPVEGGEEGGGDAADVTAASQVISEQTLPPLNAPITVSHRRDLSSNLNPLSIVKSPLSDGFNWRKYGQKQVKTPQGSRSYYKCTHSDCSAKKIECSDLNGHLLEIVNKGLHSHDPPFNNYNSLRDNKAASSTTNAVYTEHPIKMISNGEPEHIVSLNESIKETSVVVHERKRTNSASDDGNSEMQDKEKPISDSEPKKRMKKCNSENSTDLSKPEKKSKFVVHAAGDVGISGDGYRWRKYGQKMVKGNPHPRNYYRCTSAGCPVRKHIEADVDNTSAVIITYKGVHDHDMPVPKKRHGPTSAPLLTAAAPASKNNNGQQKKSDSNQNQKTQWSVDKEAEITGESTIAVGGEKVVESTRTLLSVGFEIKPC